MRVYDDLAQYKAKALADLDSVMTLALSALERARILAIKLPGVSPDMSIENDYAARRKQIQQIYDLGTARLYIPPLLESFRRNVNNELQQLNQAEKAMQPHERLSNLTITADRHLRALGTRGDVELRYAQFLSLAYLFADTYQHLVGPDDNMNRLIDDYYTELRLLMRPPASGIVGADSRRDRRM
jgi:hypothetical protein